MPVKLEWLGYRMVEKLWRYVKPFLIQYQRVTDRQTDGRTDGRTELLYQYRASAAVCWRAIKTRCNTRNTLRRHCLCHLSSNSLDLQIAEPNLQADLSVCSAHTTEGVARWRALYVLSVGVVVRLRSVRNAKQKAGMPLLTVNACLIYCSAISNGFSAAIGLRQLCYEQLHSSMRGFLL